MLNFAINNEAIQGGVPIPLLTNNPSNKEMSVMVETTITKICSKCKVEKSSDRFSKNPKRKDGLKSWCKDCHKEYYYGHKEEILAQKKQYYQDNKVRIRKYNNQRYTPVISIKKNLPVGVRFCKCGCGTQIIIKEHHRWRGIPDYISGHHSRVHNPMQGVHLYPSKATREKMRKARIGKAPIMEGKTHTDEAKRKISIAVKKRWEDKEYRKKMTNVTKKLWEDPEYKKCQLGHIKTRTEKRKANGEDHPMLGFKHSKETIANMRKAHIGLTDTEATKLKKSLAITGIKRSKETKALISKIAKIRYLDPAYVKKMAKAWNIKPNKPETIILNLLNDLYPGEWKYTGDFSFTINGKCPDFVNCNGQKKIIELFGDYWHRGDNPQDRIDVFSPFGYQTLVIWESELKHINSVIKRIQKFMVA